MVSRGSYYCDSLLPACYQEGRKAEGSGLPPCSGSRTPQARLEPWHPSPEAVATRILLKRPCQTSRVNMKNTKVSAQQRALEGSREKACHARGWVHRLPRWQPLGRPGLPGPGKGWIPDADAILILLGLPSAVGSVALALPQEQVAFAVWHLFLEGGCQEGANLGITQCVCRVLARGLFTPWRGSPGPDLVDEVRARLVLSSQSAPPPNPYLQALQVSPRRVAGSCVLGASWGTDGRHEKGRRI